MDDGRIAFEQDGYVGLLTLDRPAKLNAATRSMSAELLELIPRIDDDPSIRAVVVTGAGDRAFSVGSDIGELDRYDGPWHFRNRRDYCDALRALRTPVIAAINGYAYGGGLELALSCDIRLASSSASFAAAEIKLGWIGGGGVTALLTASVPASDAAMMLLTGDPIDAAKALRVGLVSQVLPPSEVLPAATELAHRIAARPPIAAQAAKANLRAAWSMGLEQAIQYERELQAIALGTRDAAEGRAAFAERRTGDFEGR
ncbi:enoyl-CoA hydratase/isomerase family protein [Kribbella capetownensis]|uniref:Enoyl-CoA hydratase/isomerase family protein n=1 Tax=Kribbella capetownensis TaxID=1572659 RepID=A0A4R0J9K7_9ACTN|nr:enoyl-CoA hydratase/isomerase family protein [Kribbella capetownensis]TCC42879.1 enoyl-CoA hydratase/isomerase family protein [Kribbella capetownensis]